MDGSTTQKRGAVRGNIMPEYSKHQKGIIKRYYEHRDTIAWNRLSEIVSDLYLETNPARIKRAWKSALQQMLAAGVPERVAKAIVEDQDLGALARVVQKRC